MTWFEPDRRLQRPSAFARVWEGEVVTLVPLTVKIPALAGNEHKFGPCRTVEGDWSAGVLAAVTGSSSAHTHTIAVPAALAVGNAVLVAFLGGDRGRPVIVGRLRP